MQDGQTALSIAESLGYKPVVDLLKDVTDVMVSPAMKKRKINLAVPETMQEAAMSDLEDEGYLTLTSINIVVCWLLCLLEQNVCILSHSILSNF